MELLNRGLMGFVAIVFLVVSTWSVYLFVFTETTQHGTTTKGKALWMYGAVVVGVSIGSIAVMVMVGLGRLALT